MKQVLISCDVLDPEGNVLTLSNKELELGYRTSIIQRKNYIVLAATIGLKEGNKEEIAASLYATLEEKGGYQIGAANQTITAILASEQVADYLAVKKGEAILRMRQISFFDDRTPFEYVRSQYVGSRFEFYLEK